MDLLTERSNVQEPEADTRTGITDPATAPPAQQPARRLESFEEFWPFYVGEHLNPLCRLLHYIGGLGAIACLVLAAVNLDLLFVPLAPVVGYGFAWVAHCFVERNKPATFGYPAWSFRAEFKMLVMGLTGRMGREVLRLHPEAFDRAAKG